MIESEPILSKSNRFRITPIERFDRFTEMKVELFRVDWRNFWGQWKKLPMRRFWKSAWYLTREDAEIAIHCILNKIDRHIEIDGFIDAE